jgi:hypothetical protein
MRRGGAAGGILWLQYGRSAMARFLHNRAPSGQWTVRDRGARFASDTIAALAAENLWLFRN